MATIKCLSIEGNFEFENYNDSELVNHIKRDFWDTKDAITRKVEARIGIIKESKDDIFGFFPLYENDSEIESEVNSEFTKMGYSKEITHDGYIMQTPNYRMYVSYGKDFGGVECVKEVVTISIEEL